MTQRLVPWPRPALAVFAACAAVVAVLGLLVHDDTHINWLDSAVKQWAQRKFSTPTLQLALHLTDPQLIIGLLATIAVTGALMRRWDVTVLAAVAPALAVVLTEEVLKPLIHRSATTGLGQTESFAYPSGHETGIAGLGAVAGLLLLGSTVRRGRKIGGLVAIGGVLLAAAVGLVGLFYHFATDTVGAVGVAMATTIGVALVIDQIGAMFSSRTREPALELR